MSGRKQILFVIEEEELYLCDKSEITSDKDASFLRTGLFHFCDLLTFWAVGVAEECMQEECKDTGLSFSASVHCTNRDCETVTQCIH